MYIYIYFVGRYPKHRTDVDTNYYWVLLLLFKIFECVLFSVAAQIGKYINSDAYPTRWIVLLKLHVIHTRPTVDVCVFVNGRYFLRFFFISFSTKSTHDDSHEHVFHRLGQYENDVPRTYIIITLYALPIYGYTIGIYYYHYLFIYLFWFVFFSFSSI